ncbi:membrane protein [Salinifilum aidingensis]
MAAVLGLLGAALGVAVVSAVFPLISVEIFALGVLFGGADVPWWALALVIAVGQIAGKTLHYGAARGAVRLPGLLRRTGRFPRRRARTRAAALLERFRDTCRQRPAWSGGVLLASAAASVPPFAATAAVAGWARVSLALFLVTGFTGRLVRFGVLTAAPALVHGSAA